MLKYVCRGYQTASRINHQLIELHSHTHIHQYKGQQLTHLSDGSVTGSQSDRALFRWAYQVLSWQRHSSIHSQLSLVGNIALCCLKPCGLIKCLDTDEDLVHFVTLRHLFKTIANSNLSNSYLWKPWKPCSISAELHWAGGEEQGASNFVGIMISSEMCFLS